MSATRAGRQGAIREIVRGGAIRTQNELVEALREHGFEVTQATVSRDIADLDLRKDASGHYALAEDMRLEALAAAAIRETRRAGNQVIVLTDPGSASSVAAALDAAQVEGVLGCIAGDDTILVIARDERSGEKFQERVNSLLS